MSAIKPEWIVWGLGAGVAVIVINSLVNGSLLTKTASTVGRVPIDVFIGGAEGLLGLPDTRTRENQAKCAAARAAGRDWEASFVCPAATWFKGLFDWELF